MRPSHKGDKMYKISYSIDYLNEKFLNLCTSVRTEYLYRRNNDDVERQTQVFANISPAKDANYGIKFSKLRLPHGYTRKFELEIHYGRWKLNRFHLLLKISKVYFQ